MYSRNGCYAKAPDVVVRGFEEWGHAFAFTPDEPDLHDLNSTAWLILDLCNGRPFAQIEADYIEAVGPLAGAEIARTQFHQGFDMLLKHSIIANSDV